MVLGGVGVHDTCHVPLSFVTDDHPLRRITKKLASKVLIMLKCMKRYVAVEGCYCIPVRLNLIIR